MLLSNTIYILLCVDFSQSFLNRLVFVLCMVRNQSRSNRKPSGSRYKQLRVRRQHESGREAARTKVADEKKISVRTLGGNSKTKALAVEHAYVVNSKGKHKKTPIEGVVENAANKQFVRRNIITQGAIIETGLGRARVTSRPGQTGSVQAVLLE